MHLPAPREEAPGPFLSGSWEPAGSLEGTEVGELLSSARLCRRSPRLSCSSAQGGRQGDGSSEGLGAHHIPMSRPGGLGGRAAPPGTQNGPPGRSCHADMRARARQWLPGSTLRNFARSPGTEPNALRATLGAKQPHVPPQTECANTSEHLQCSLCIIPPACGSSLGETPGHLSRKDRAPLATRPQPQGVGAVWGRLRGCRPWPRASLGAPTRTRTAGAWEPRDTC